MIKMQSNWPEPYGESGIRTNVQPIYHVVNSITGIHSLSIEWASFLNISCVAAVICSNLIGNIWLAMTKNHVQPINLFAFDRI